MQQELLDDDEIVPLDQLESEEDVRASASATQQAVTFNTDWTVETLFLQIQKGNINLDPQFQRREAWDESRQSKLIESILSGFPVPNVVLAEDQRQKGKYLVIDGKQRLASIANFLSNKLVLKNLAVRDDLNGMNLDALKTFFKQDVTHIENQTIRTVVIRNWPDENYLYTVFFRLNSGSLPLSPQELRKALHGGKLLDYIDEFIRSSEGFKAIFGDKLDRRMRDIELVLRFVAFERWYQDYKGDLKQFLDDAVIFYDKNWDRERHRLDLDLQRLEIALKTTKQVFGVDAFKKWSGDKFERRINRAVFDIVSRYFADDAISNIVINADARVVESFKQLCSSNEAFRNSIERTTKTPLATNTRHRLWGETLAPLLGLSLDYGQMRLG